MPGALFDRASIAVDLLPLPLPLPLLLQVFLESVLLEIRANDWNRAAIEAQEALKVHSGAGRLWAVLVQLKQRDSDQAQQASLKQVKLAPQALPASASGGVRDDATRLSVGCGPRKPENNTYPMCTNVCKSYDLRFLGRLGKWHP